jgi:copper chaperone
MIAFDVGDMTCGHCASTITKAVAAVDGAARVRVDLAAHRVEIEAASASEAQLRAAIEAAGYTPAPAGPGPGGR